MANPAACMCSMSWIIADRSVLSLPQVFHFVVLSEQCFDSSTGQRERASVERPIAVVDLKDIVGLGNDT